MTISVTESRGNPPSDDRRNDIGTPGTSSDPRDRLRTAIAAILAEPDEAGSTRAMDAVKLAARTLVNELRRAEQPPEKMLIQIKRILADAGLEPAFPTMQESEYPELPATSVYRTIIEWSIRYYYDGNCGDGLRLTFSGR
jgi:hypothetical protein